jgi:SAM-dependent methyltransferase
MTEVPRYWKRSSWEEKARENPLFAIQTTTEMSLAPAEDFPPELVASLFARGRRIFRENLAPLLTGEEVVFEYGCGAGRVLNAVVESGRRALGVDISPTMLGHCRRLVPQAEVYQLSEGRAALADGSADFVFSFAVFQHIARLSDYMAALDEAARVLRPGGVMTLHLPCEDWSDGGRTENFEDHSLHYRAGESEPWRTHRQHHVSGVRIGRELLVRALAERGVEIADWRGHAKDKPSAVWATGRKLHSPGLETRALDRPHCQPG